ncbi:MAG: trypsin-like serine protease, partial [Ginsengibacter sp.]
SVPLQPGNSGGPLFDKNGNLIGIVKAKLSGGENVSYAIKAAYLKNLIDLVPTIPALITTGSISKFSLAEKVKILNKFVYIIEIK